MEIATSFNRNDLLLDRAVVLDLAMNRGTADQVRSLAPCYKRILFETAEMSGIESVVAKIPIITEKCVVLPKDIGALTKENESDRISNSIREATRLPAVLRALQRAGMKRGGVPRPAEEVLGYVARLLLLTRRLQSDLFPAPERLELLKTWFDEAGLSCVEFSKNGVRILESPACDFPYLPGISGAVGHSFRFVVPGSDSELPPRESHDGSAETRSNMVFVSYSHKDVRWLKKLEVVLAPIVHKGLIQQWADTRIPAGGDWRREIEDSLLVSRVAVLLVTPQFLASEFIMRCELPIVLACAARRTLTVFWIPVSASLYQTTELGSLQAATDPKRPLDSLSVAAQNRVLSQIGLKVLDALNDATRDG